MGIITVTNMGNEMFNDAIFYTEQVTITESQFTKWRYSRSAIISFCASAEAEISKLIKHSLEKIETLTPRQAVILNFLTDPNSEGAPPHEISSIQRKYTFLRKVNGLRYAKINSEYDKITKLRNKIIHYSYSAHNEIYSNQIHEDATNARETIKNFILELYNIVQIAPPRWVEATVSKEIT